MKEESEKKKLVRILGKNPTMMVQELAEKTGLTVQQVEEILSSKNDD